MEERSRASLGQQARPSVPPQSDSAKATLFRALKHEAAQLSLLGMLSCRVSAARRRADQTILARLAAVADPADGWISVAAWIGLGLSEEDTLRAKELGWLAVAGIGRYVLTEAGLAAANADQER